MILRQAMNEKGAGYPAQAWKSGKRTAVVLFWNAWPKTAQGRSTMTKLDLCE
jgi:hypothetical protein